MAGNTINDLLNREKSQLFKELFQSIFLSVKTEPLIDVFACKKTIFKILKLKNNKSISDGSVKEVEASFSSNPSIKSQQLDILDFVLNFLRNELNLSVPTSSKVLPISKEKPLIGVFEHRYIRRSEKLYILLEQEFKSPSADLTKQLLMGRLALNFILNEGVLDNKVLEKLINSKDCWFRYEDLFYYQVDEERQMLGLESTMLLCHYWQINENNQQFSKTKILKGINDLLKNFKVIEKNEDVTFSTLKAAYKIEHVHTVNPNVMLMTKVNKPSKQISQKSFTRFITGNTVNEDKVSKVSSTNSKKWANIWIKNKSESNLSFLGDPVSYGSQEIDNMLNQLKGKRFQNTETNKQILDNVINWLETPTNLNQHGATWLVINWLLKLLQKGNVKEKPTIDLIKSYIKTIKKYFLPIFAGVDIKCLSLDSWAEMFNESTNAVSNPKAQSHIRYFLNFLVGSGLISKEIYERVEFEGIPIKVSANLISNQHATYILNVLGESEKRINKIARLVFCFGKYGGNRRGEVKHTQIRDIISNDNYITQRLYSRKEARLKSYNSNRYIPNDILWPEEELRVLKCYLKERKSFCSDSKNTLFDEQELEKAFNLITEILIEITGDPNIGFHVLRHSFCNDVVLLLSSPDDFNFQNILCPNYFNHSRLNALKNRMGISDNSTRKLMSAASEILGHGGIITTLKHYFHLTEIYWLLHKNSYCPSIETFTKKLFGYHTKINTAYPLTVSNNVSLTKDLSKFRRFNCASKPVNNKKLKAILEKYSRNLSSLPAGKITMLDLWNMFYLKEKGLSQIEIVNHEEFLINDIVNVFDISQNISKAYPKGSKNKLPDNPLTNISEKKKNYVKFLCKRLDGLKFQDLVTFCIQESMKPIKNMSVSRHYLIKSQKYHQIIDLMIILRCIGLNINTRIKIKVYCSPKSTEDFEACDRAIKSFEESFGSDFLQNINIVFPKKYQLIDYSDVFNNLNISQSDEFLYSSESCRLEIALHIFNRKGKRDMSYMSFFHILLIYSQLPKSQISNFSISAHDRMISYR